MKEKDRRKRNGVLQGGCIADSIAVLYKGGRLPGWQQLEDEKRRAYEQEHVDLMLQVAKEYGLQRLEGFRLLAPQGAYERFWVIEFPGLDGAEAWIEAEMAAPYGRFGYYEYHLARRQVPAYCADWAPGYGAAKPLQGDPHRIPALAADDSSMVGLAFERGKVLAEEPVPQANTDKLQAVATAHGLQRLECFRLVAPQADWHRVWVAEFPTVAGVEAWIQVQGAGGDKLQRPRFSLARKWAPEYFAGWTAEAQGS